MTQRAGKRSRYALGALFGVMLAVSPAAAQRIRYAPVAPGDYVLLHGEPKLSIRRRPPDFQVLPDTGVLDGDALDDDGEALDPAAEQRAADRLALSQLSQNYRPRPAIWRIGDADTTIYLFGTIHVLPPGFQWRSAALERVVAASDSLLLESVGGDGPTTVMPRAALPLAERVSPDHRAALARFADRLPPGAMAQLDAMPSWVAAIAIGYVRDMQAGETPGPGADDWLEARFRQMGKPVVAIEDTRAVMAHVAAIPEAKQRAMLNATLDAPGQSRAALRAPTHAWAKGEVGEGSALKVEFDTANGGDVLKVALLRDRNAAWVSALATRLRAPGTTLFAAGAGHFIGPGSVLDLLKRRGISVVRID